MSIWWPSFADDTRPKGEQFLGAVMVRALTFIEAVRVSHILKLNPGGEVQGTPCPAKIVALVPPAWVERLLSREEVKQFDAEMKPLLENAGI